LTAELVEEIKMSKQNQTKQIAKQILNSEKSVQEIVELIQSQSSTANIQLQILDGFNAAAQDQGRYAGGTPTLGDEILDAQYNKVKKYGKSAYKLSDKQVTVIINDVYGYRKI
jgi:hypothetical protein